MKFQKKRLNNMGWAIAITDASGKIHGVFTVFDPDGRWDIAAPDGNQEVRDYLKSVNGGGSAPGLVEKPKAVESLFEEVQEEAPSVQEQVPPAIDFVEFRPAETDLMIPASVPPGRRSPLRRAPADADGDHAGEIRQIIQANEALSQGAFDGSGDALLGNVNVLRDSSGRQIYEEEIPENQPPEALFREPTITRQPKPAPIHVKRQPRKLSAEDATAMAKRFFDK